ncbi:hypothetical protein B0H10DRAFT_2206732 [Mycena sp. CBHHK59/15]|nr:hypothetical protein B0H10DRAFT_2206732 [Mycena sp. CBHHK59/15]
MGDIASAWRAVLHPPLKVADWDGRTRDGLESDLSSTRTLSPPLRHGSPSLSDVSPPLDPSKEELSHRASCSCDRGLPHDGSSPYSRRTPHTTGPHAVPDIGHAQDTAASCRGFACADVDLVVVSMAGRRARARGVMEDRARYPVLAKVALPASSSCSRGRMVSVLLCELVVHSIGVCGLQAIERVLSEREALAAWPWTRTRPPVNDVKLPADQPVSKPAGIFGTPRPGDSQTCAKCAALKRQQDEFLHTLPLFLLIFANRPSISHPVDLYRPLVDATRIVNC